MSTEQRLVDANVLIEKEKPMDSITHGMVMAVQSEHILDAPTVDAVEVVRCRECVFWDGDRRCNGRINGLVMEYTDWDDFCSYGERRTNG